MWLYCIARLLYQKHETQFHNQEEGFLCTLCDYVYAVADEESHYKDDHDNKREIVTNNTMHDKKEHFHCEQCNFVASQDCYLKRHIDEDHNKNKGYQFKICDYFFAYEDKESHLDDLHDNY